MISLIQQNVESSSPQNALKGKDLYQMTNYLASSSSRHHHQHMFVHVLMRGWFTISKKIIKVLPKTIKIIQLILQKFCAPHLQKIAIKGLEYLLHSLASLLYCKSLLFSILSQNRTKMVQLNVDFCRLNRKQDFFMRSPLPTCSKHQAAK